MRIAIDAGHGGTDSGALGVHGEREADVTLEYSLRFRDLVRDRTDYAAILTRTKDVFVELSERVKVANREGCKAFVSFHCNADADPDTDPAKQATGIEVWYYETSEKSRRLAEAAVVNLHEAFPQLLRCKAMPTKVLYVLRHTHMPGILVETGFIDSPKDLARLQDPVQRSLLLHAVLAAVETVFGPAIEQIS